MAIDKTRILKHLQTEVYCRLGVSPIHGIGVFAIRDIPKGTHPLVSLLKIKEFSFTKKEIKKLCYVEHHQKMTDHNHGL